MKVYVAMMEMRGCDNDGKTEFYGKCLGVALTRKAALLLCKKQKDLYVSVYNEVARECGAKDAKPKQWTQKMGKGKCEIIKLDMTDGFVCYFFWVDRHDLATSGGAK